VITISKKEQEKIQNLNLHNAKFTKIICDYDERTAQMPIIMTGKCQYPALLTFENILQLECNLKKPRESGLYILEVSIDDADGDYFRVIIILNSGDKVNIITSKMIFSSIE
jgi:hypothetical protein